MKKQIVLVTALNARIFIDSWKDVFNITNLPIKMNRSNYSVETEDKIYQYVHTADGLRGCRNVKFIHLQPGPFWMETNEAKLLIEMATRK